MVGRVLKVAGGLPVRRRISKLASLLEFAAQLILIALADSIVTVFPVGVEGLAVGGTTGASGSALQALFDFALSQIS